MYRPSYTSQNETQDLLDFAQQHSFATLITADSGCGTPFISHLPLLVERPTGENKLGSFSGHLARANPHSKLLGQKEVTVIFHGPHSYISPRLYSGDLNVPTWNYAVVHARAKGTMIEDAIGIIDILKRTVAYFEKETPARWGRPPWVYDLPEDFNSQLVRAIVGFKLEILAIEGKFKLSQNRDEEDYDGVFEAFEKAKTDNDRAMFALMEKFSLKR